MREFGNLKQGSGNPVLLWSARYKQKKGSRLSKPSARENFSALPTWSTRPTTGFGARTTSLWVHLLRQLSRDGNLHAWFWACHTPRQPLKHHLSGHLGGWTMPWSAEEMPDGQHKRGTSRPITELLTRTSRRKDDLYWVVPHVPPITQSVEELTRLNSTKQMGKTEQKFRRNRLNEKQQQKDRLENIMKRPKTLRLKYNIEKIRDRQKVDLSLTRREHNTDIIRKLT